MPLGLIQVGVAARGVDRTDPAGRMPMPTLPFSPRQRTIATLLAATLLTLPGIVGGVAFHAWRIGSVSDGLAGAARVSGWIVPFLVAGAVLPSINASWPWMAVGCLASIGAHASGLVMDPVGAVVWGVVGSALLLWFGPRLEGTPARPGSELVARVRGPAAWKERARVPLRAWLRLQSAGWRVGLVLLLIATGATAASWTGAAPTHLGALTVGPLAWAACFVPAWPGASGQGAAAILRRLPIHPRAAWRGAVFGALLPLAFALVVPLTALGSGLVTTASDTLAAAAALAVFATLLVRAGGTGRNFLRDRVPADVCRGAGVFLYASALLLEAVGHWRGFSTLPAHLVALGTAVPTVVLLVWADRSAGLPRTEG